jgi:hypothetical protein
MLDEKYGHLMADLTESSEVPFGIISRESSSLRSKKI